MWNIASFCFGETSGHGSWVFLQVCNVSDTRVLGGLARPCTEIFSTASPEPIFSNTDASALLLDKAVLEVVGDVTRGFMILVVD